MTLYYQLGLRQMHEMADFQPLGVVVEELGLVKAFRDPH